MLSGTKGRLTVSGPSSAQTSSSARAGRPWLEEVNTNAFIPDFFEKEAREAMQVLLPDPTRTTENAALQARLALIDSFCDTQQPAPPERRVWCFALTKYGACFPTSSTRTRGAHGTSHWTRIFPARTPMFSRGQKADHGSEPGVDVDLTLHRVRLWRHGHSASNPQRNEFEHEYLARKFGGAGSDSAASELDIATWKFVNSSTHQTCRRTKKPSRVAAAEIRQENTGSHRINDDHRSRGDTRAAWHRKGQGAPVALSGGTRDTRCPRYARPGWGSMGEPGCSGPSRCDCYHHTAPPFRVPLPRLLEGTRCANWLRGRFAVVES